MKKIEVEKVIKEDVGYESNDGHVFETESACRDYENSANYVIEMEFKKLLVGNETFAESDIFTNQGYGSEEYKMGVLDIKNADDLKIANQYMHSRLNKIMSPDVIGKKVLVNIGYPFDQIQGIDPNPRTEEELIEQFKNDIHCFFDGSVFNKEEM